MDYFTDDKKIVVYTEDGETLEQECRIKKTPVKEKLDKIRKRKQQGKAVFTDSAVYTGGESFTAVKAEVFYDGEKVSERRFPRIEIGSADTLQIEFNLEIVYAGNSFTVRA